MRTPDGNAMTEPALTAKQTGDNICKHNATENVYQAEPNGSETATIEQISSLNKIRLLYFFFRFSTGSLVPFMPMFMQHCGFNNEDIGKLQAIRPVITMVGAPCWGGLADRTGKKKMLLIVSIANDIAMPQLLYTSWFFLIL
jgi:nitrate/nitrite transporter NarK